MVKGLTLTERGKEIVRRGGHDDATQDDLLFLEILNRAPGLTPDDHERVFVALLEAYGEDALKAVQSGHVQFEKVAAGTRPEPIKREE